MIKHVIFDFGGVLMDWNPRYLYRDYFRDDVKMEWFLANVCSPDWNVQMDAGKPFAEAVKELQAQWPEYSEAIAAFDSGWPKMLKGCFPDTVELLKDLKAKGYGIYGLTNWSAEKFPYAYERYDFFSQFDGIVVSGAEKMVKPFPGLYEVLLDRYRLEPSECLFIDDSQANCDTARSLGIHAVHFENIKQVRRDVWTSLR